MKRALSAMMILSLLAGVFVAPVFAGGSYWLSGSESLHVDEDEDAPGAPPPGEFMILDALLLRPLGLASMGVGIGGAVVTAPWAAASNSGEQAAEQLIRKPAWYTFCRPLGRIE